MEASSVVAGETLTSARRTSPAQLAWLDRELAQWASDEVITAAQATQIRSRYVAAQRFTLSRIVLTLGAVFVGVGLIWLVAANRNELAPWLRFALVVLLWAGMTVAALIVAARRAAIGDVASPVVGALRLMAVAAYGGVIFQAAQSLNVPTYAPRLIAVWAIGALVFAYAVRGVAPLVAGVGLSAFWVIWTAMDVAPGRVVFAAAAGAAAALATAIGVLHLRFGLRDFAWPWRLVGAGLALLALFVACLPFSVQDEKLGAFAFVMLGLAVLASVAAGVSAATRLDRAEVLLAVVTLAVTLVMGYWSTSTGDAPTGADYLRAALTVVAYLVIASGYAVLGAVRGLPAITGLATAGLVLFVTMQAFAVFARIMTGAVLFLAVGVVLLATGILVERGRRRIVSGADDLTGQLGDTPATGRTDRDE